MLYCAQIINFRIFYEFPLRDNLVWIYWLIIDSHGINVGFVSATCWIQGVYVYKSLYGRVDDVGYFGIPADIDLDGYLPNTPEHELCMTMQKKSNGEVHKNPACKPLEKSFYLQVTIVVTTLHKRWTLLLLQCYEYLTPSIETAYETFYWR